MSELKALDFHGKKVIDSRDVAEMVERPHNDLMKSIRLYIKYLGEGGISHTDFFIESNYLDKQGRKTPCYLITKKGCDMIANKLTGKKGVLFTAAYVTAFEEMQQALTAPARPMLPDGVTLGSVVGLIRVMRRTMLDAGSGPMEVGAMIKQTLESVSFPVPTSFAKQIPGQLCLFEHTEGEV